MYLPQMDAVNDDSYVFISNRVNIASVIHGEGDLMPANRNIQSLLQAVKRRGHWSKRFHEAARLAHASHYKRGAQNM
jgi:hypothetical protein